MSDILFHCPHCSQEIEAPSDMAGTAVACPNCENSIEVPGNEGAPKKKVTVQKRGSAKKQISINKSPGSSATAASAASAAPASGATRKRKKASITTTPAQSFDDVPSSGGSRHNDFMPQQVILSDIQMPFGRMVVFILKWMLAAIPAIILFYLIFGLAALAFSGVIAGIFAASGM